MMRFTFFCSVGIFYASGVLDLIYLRRIVLNIILSASLSGAFGGNVYYSIINNLTHSLQVSSPPLSLEWTALAA